METASAMVDAKIANLIGVLTLNNPRKQNALSRELIDELCAALENMRREQARVIILRAQAGQKCSRPATMCASCRPMAAIR